MTRGTKPRAARALLGREREYGVLNRLLTDARRQQGSALVLHGDPGVGKTALLEWAVAAADGFQVARVGGVEAEMELPVAVVHQLCAPFLDLAHRLPGPQRDALHVAFGVSSGPAPDPFLVSLAALGLLSEAAERRPLLVVVDDAQWLDRASARVLAFIARRLVADRIVLLFGTRDLSGPFEGLSALEVQPLGHGDARALLLSALGTPLDEQVLDRLVAETRGNPLALLELPRGLTATELAGGFGLPAAQLSASIEESFTRRFVQLPDGARRLLLLVSADPTGDPALVWRAAERLAIPVGAADVVESAGWLDLSPRLAFWHPLVRSAVYRAADSEERRAIHQALADATDPAADPDRRVWHRAQAAAAADEDVAAELERSATRAEARGGLAAAAAFLERAAALTPTRSEAARRSLAAAHAKILVGAFDGALALIEAAETAGALDDRGRATAHLLRAQITFASQRGADAPPLLLEAAREFERIDTEIARAAYLDAWFAARFAGELSGAAGLIEVSRAATAALAGTATQRPSDLLLHGLAVQITDGYAAGVPLLKAALAAFEHQAQLPTNESRRLLLALWAASDLWDDDTWRRLTFRELDRARDAGALTAMPLALSMLIYIHATCGELTSAEAALDELRNTSEATGLPVPPYGALWIGALRGADAETGALMRAASTEAATRGEGYTTLVIEHVAAVLYNGLGQFDRTVATLRRQAIDPTHRDGSPRPMAELVEAAALSGQRAIAERAFGRLVETTTAAGTDWALGIEARSRALLCEGDDADRFFREAIERLALTTIRVQVSRSHLLYGEWLRRVGRTQDARRELRVAYEEFSDFGTQGFADRSRRELGAAGERVSRPTRETHVELTPQELQVARLAAAGESNRAIAARLFVSARTVEYHLSKVFRKLEVTSRTQLARRLS